MYCQAKESFYKVVGGNILLLSLPSGAFFDFWKLLLKSLLSGVSVLDRITGSIIMIFPLI
jgi:hypothetical protein